MAMLYLGGEDTGERVGLRGLLNLLTTIFVSNASPRRKMRMLERGTICVELPSPRAKVRAMGALGIPEGERPMCSDMLAAK